MRDELRRKHSWCARALGVGLCIGFVGVGGCVPDGPQPPRQSEPVTLSKPAGLEVRTVGFAVDNTPLDTDGNGFFDTWLVTAFLLPDQNRHPLAIFGEGDLGFALRDPEGNVLARWRFTQEQLRDNRIVQYVGESYRLGVSMLDAASRVDVEALGPSDTFEGGAAGEVPAALRGTDRYRPGRAVLFMTYYPAEDGQRAIDADRGVGVRVGATGV